MFTFIIFFQDSVYKVSNGNNESERTPPPKTPKKTLIEKTLEKFSSTGGSVPKSGKQVYPSKGNHKQAYVPYPISQVEGRWMYQQPQHYVYHHRQSNHNQQHYQKSPNSYVYNQAPVWIQNYTFSPETPPIDYEFSDSAYDRYGSNLCSHIDKYGTQRGSKYTTNARRECKKCKKDEAFRDDNLSFAHTRNNLRNFDEKHPILGIPYIYKDPYNYQYSKGSEEKDDEWSSYWDREEDDDDDEPELLPLQKLFIGSKEARNNTGNAKVTLENTNLPKSFINKSCLDPAAAVQNNSSKSSKTFKNSLLDEDVKFGPSVNIVQTTKQPQLTTFGSNKGSKTSETPGTESAFPKTGIIVVEDEINVTNKIQRELEPIRPFEEESTSSDSSSSSTDDNVGSRNKISIPNDRTDSTSPNSIGSSSTPINQKHFEDTLCLRDSDEQLKTWNSHEKEDSTKDSFINSSDPNLLAKEIRKQSGNVDSFEGSRPKQTNLIEQRRLNKINHHKHYYRKYQSRNHRGRKKSPTTTGIIDEIILEEDEDAIEAENLEIISTPIKVKSILKYKHPQLVDSTISNTSELTTHKNDNNSLSDEKVDETDLEEIKSEGDGSTSKITNEVGKEISDIPSTNNCETRKSDSSTNMKKLRRKGVTFNSFTANQTGEHFDNVSSSSAVNRLENGEISSSEDELQGYSTVIVSQNLTSEILQEIYGTHGTDNPKIADGNIGVHEDDTHCYEEFPGEDTMASTENKRSKEVKRNLKPIFKIGDEIHTPRVSSDQINSSRSKNTYRTDISSFEPKSLADEIFDEVYGNCPDDTTNGQKGNEIPSTNDNEEEEGTYETIGESKETKPENVTAKHSKTDMVPKRGCSVNSNQIGNKSSESNSKPEFPHNPALIGKCLY